MYTEHYYTQCISTLRVPANFLVNFNPNQTLIFSVLLCNFFQTLREVFSKPEVKRLTEDSEKIEMATAFDTMWAIMLALKEARIALQTTDTPLEYNVNKTNGDDVVTSTIESKLLNVSFEGLTVIA